MANDNDIVLRLQFADGHTGDVQHINTEADVVQWVKAVAPFAAFIQRFGKLRAGAGFVFVEIICSRKQANCVMKAKFKQAGSESDAGFLQKVELILRVPNAKLHMFKAIKRTGVVNGVDQYRVPNIADLKHVGLHLRPFATASVVTRLEKRTKISS